MSTILRYRDTDGTWKELPVIKGNDGKDGEDVASVYVGEEQPSEESTAVLWLNPNSTQESDLIVAINEVTLENAWVTLGMNADGTETNYATWHHTNYIPVSSASKVSVLAHGHDEGDGKLPLVPAVLFFDAEKNVIFYAKKGELSDSEILYTYQNADYAVETTIDVPEGAEYFVIQKNTDPNTGLAKYEPYAKKVTTVKAFIDSLKYKNADGTWTPAPIFADTSDMKKDIKALQDELLGVDALIGEVD